MDVDPGARERYVERRDKAVKLKSLQASAVPANHPCCGHCDPRVRENYSQSFWADAGKHPPPPSTADIAQLGGTGASALGVRPAEDADGPKERQAVSLLPGSW